MRTDGVEPPQPEAPRLQREELARAQRPHERWEPKFESRSRFPGASLRARRPAGQCLTCTARRLAGAQRREAACGARLCRAGPGRRPGKRGVADRIRTDTAGLTTPGARRYTTATMDGDDRNRTGDRSPDKRVLLPSELRPRSSAGGIRTHDLELMRLARTAPPLPRESGRQDSNLRSPVPETGGVARLRYEQTRTPAGLEPAASGLRIRRHPLRPRGIAPAAGLEPALSRVTTACLTD